MRNRGRLAPLLGLQGSRQAEQMPAGALPMRGGYNMDPVDGEWWSRDGRPVLSSQASASDPVVVAQLGNIQWNGILSTDHRDYIWSQDYVLDINANGLVNGAYAESDNVAGTMNDSLPWFFYPVPSGDPAKIFVGDLLITGARGTYGQCYRVIKEEVNSGDPSGNSRLAYLDRYWTSPTPVTGSGSARDQSVTVRVIPSLHSTWKHGTAVVHGAPPTRDLTVGTKGSACLFDQLVTFTGSTSSAQQIRGFDGRRTYMVITSADLTNPVAILLDNQAGADQSGTDHVSEPRKAWYQNTAISYTDDANLIPNPYFCCVSNGRLIIGRAQDDQGGFASRTIWYSAQGNMTAWHTGVQNETSSPNYVTFDQRDLNDIRGLLPLGNRFVVHRRHSQMVASFTGSNTAPFQFAENNQDIGLEAYGAVTLAGGLHFFPTDAGPAVFDGQTVTPIGAEIRAHLAQMGFWFGEPFAVGHDRERKLIYFFTSHKRHQDSIPSPAGTNPVNQPPAPTAPENRVLYNSPGTLTNFYSAAPTLVYSIDRQAWYFEDQPALGALGQVKEGGTWGMRLDGTILNMKDGATPEIGLDAAVACTIQYGSVTQLSRISIAPQAVDALVETPWVSFGTLERKMITKIVLQLRGWAAEDVYSALSDSVHACTIEIFTNGDPETVRSTINVQHTVAEMRNLGLDENRQQPLMLFELSPRVSGENFKFRFKNALPAGSSLKKVPMRIANVEVFYDQEESNRPITSL